MADHRRYSGCGTYLGRDAVNMLTRIGGSRALDLDHINDLLRYLNRICVCEVSRVIMYLPIQRVEHFTVKYKVNRF